MAKINLKVEAKKLINYTKTYWDKPREGEYVSIKEFVAYIVAQSGCYLATTFVGFMAFSAGYFCGSIMGISQMDFYLISLASTIINYVLIFMNPINVLIYENHGKLEPKVKLFANVIWIVQLLVGIGCYFLPSDRFESVMKGLPQIVGNILVAGVICNYANWFIRRKFCATHGRIKPFLVLYGIPSAVLLSIIPYLPVENMDYTAKLVVLHLAFTLMNNFLGSYNNTAGLINFISPNSQERQRFLSIAPIVTGLVPSIISAFLPMLIASTGGYLSITTYKVYVPIFSLAGVLMSLAVIKCNERVIERKDSSRKKVTFFHGAKQVLQNKYFWILNIASILYNWNGLFGSILAWWFIYCLRMEWFSGIAANIVVLTMTLGNILTPILTKRFPKQKILMTTRIISACLVACMTLAIKTGSIVLLMAIMLMKNALQPIETGVANGLNADVLDYHQWRYGERADAMTGLFSWFLNPVTVAMGYLLPWMLQQVGFTSDWDVMFDMSIMNNVFTIYIWGSVISLVLATIPFIFYDMTKEKHDMCIEELKLRLAAETAAEGADGESLAESGEEIDCSISNSQIEAEASVAEGGAQIEAEATQGDSEDKVTL